MEVSQQWGVPAHGQKGHGDGLEIPGHGGNLYQDSFWVEEPTGLAFFMVDSGGGGDGGERPTAGNVKFEG